MDFENNEKKQEEPTQQEGFQREIRPGRSPRPRIHTGQRPTYERQSYHQNDSEEGGFRPEGFGQSSAPQRGSYRPRQNNYEGGGYQQRPSYGQSRQGGYGQQRQGGYQPRQQGEYGQRQGGYQQRPSYGQPRQGGYGQQRQGGYQQRPSYGQPRQGGYNSGYGNKPSYGVQGGQL